MKVAWLSKEGLSQHQRKALCDIHGEEQIEHIAADFFSSEEVACFVREFDGLVYLGLEWPLKEVVERSNCSLGVFQCSPHSDRQPMAVYHVNSSTATVIWMSGLCVGDGQKVIIPIPTKAAAPLRLG